MWIISKSHREKKNFFWYFCNHSSSRHEKRCQLSLRLFFPISRLYIPTVYSYWRDLLIWINMIYPCVYCPITLNKVQGLCKLSDLKFLNFSNFTLWNFTVQLWPKSPLKQGIFPLQKKIWDLKKILCFLELEGQGHSIIMGVTHLLLLGPFMYWNQQTVDYSTNHCNLPFFLKKILNIYLGFEFEFGPKRVRDLAIVCP